MSDDWKVGDLALCVNNVGCPLCKEGCPLPQLEAGRVYRVSGVCSDEFGPILDFAEFPANPVWGFCHPHFRKIRPDEYEACEEEFRILLSLSKQRVKA